MTQTSDAPVVFDPLAPGFVESPYEQYRALRERDPVHWSDLLQGWVLTRYDDVDRVLRDPTVSVEIDRAEATPAIEAERRRRDETERGGATLVLRDDPDHARLRRLIQAPFRPRAVDALRARIHERVHRTLDDLRARSTAGSRIDLIGDFAYPLPVEVFCEMLGVPDEDHPRFRHWTRCVARALDPVMDDEERARCMAGIDEMYEYLAAQVEAKRARPADDVLSELIHAEEEGDQLTHEELMAQIVTLYVAGHEPTAGLIGNGFLALLRRPDQLARLRAEPDLVRNAVSELARYDGPNQFVRRIATEPLAIGDRRIEPGQVIYASPGAANRDPDRWGETVDRVVVDRVDAHRHLQFGAGVHACLGAHLARAQAEIALHALITRLDDVELAGEPEWSERMVIRGLARLPVSGTVR